MCLHGTVKDKCRILFHIFNLVCSVSGMNKTGNLLVTVYYYVTVIIRGFIRARKQANWPSVRMILPSWFDHLVGSFSFKEVQF